MSKEQRVQQKQNKPKRQSSLPQSPPANTFAAQGIKLTQPGQVHSLPNYLTTYRIRHATMLQMQQQYGNASVTRHILQVQQPLKYAQPGRVNRQRIEKANGAVPTIQRVHFASDYTSWHVAPHERRGDEDQTYSLSFQLNVGMERNLLSEQVDLESVQSLIANTLNHHGGGWREINGQRAYVSWTLRWVSPALVQSGRALGVSVFPESAFEESSADGIFLHAGSVSRIVLRGGAAETVLRRQTRRERRSRRSRRERGRARRRFGHSVTHEVGHAMGIVGHQDGTVMNASNSDRFDLYLNGDQIRQIVLNIATSTAAAALPNWLRGETQAETRIPTQ